MPVVTTSARDFQHGRRGSWRRSLGRGAWTSDAAEGPVGERTAERWGAALLVGVMVLVGVASALGQAGSPGWVLGPRWLWWTAYVAYVATFFTTFWEPMPPWWSRTLGIVATTALGGAVVLLAPQSWTPILLVITTAAAAYVLSPRATFVVGAVNSSILFVALLLVGAPTVEAVFGTAMYAVLQALTAWSVWLQMRETEARKQLAAVHTELKATTALLAESSRSSERLRIARDLHDLIGHQLTALALELEVAAHKAEGPATEHVRRARGLAKELLGDVRSAVGELRDRPADLRDALAEVVADLPRPHVHLDVEDQLVVDAERVATLVRITQEVVTNTIRHAEADQLTIEVRVGEDGEVVLHAADDGMGAPVLRLGNGLTGLRERVELHGGQVHFDGHRGFAITATLPAFDAAVVAT
ncbi:sensor histidine kinase [Nitriliruptoraceae bacterium ZYF776]|nr:sensor histidine kinase [Profundirhabdus halotolerans]